MFSLSVTPVGSGGRAPARGVRTLCPLKLKNFLALKMSKGGAGVRAYNESLGAVPQAGIRSKANGPGVVCLGGFWLNLGGLEPPH